MDFIIENWTQIIPYVGAIITFIVGRKSRLIKQGSSQSDLIQQNLGLYQVIIDDLEKRYNKKEQQFTEEINKLRKDYSDAMNTILDLKNKVAELNQVIFNLNMQLKNMG